MIKKISTYIFWLVLLIASIGSLIAWWYIRGPIADESGLVSIAQLKQDVVITRNEQGIPHIQAQTVPDAYFGLGFVHAQDRLWQLSFHRRVAQGRLSEILGVKALETDKFIRTLGVMQRAKAAVKEYDADTLAKMQRYADGVNAYLKHRKGPLPIEFTLTKAPEPEPWTIEDSAAWTIMMAWDLGSNWRRELRRLAYGQSWSMEKINDLLLPYPGDSHMKTVDYVALYQSIGVYKSPQSLAQAVPALIAAAPESGVEGLGSNNWVLSGSRTESGKPLLANDPHLALSTPSLWYLASLSAGSWHATGASIPALPGIILGRNTHIAWGFTNTAPDVQDTYIERINPANPNEYQTPTGWAEFTQRTEIIRVKDQADVQITTRATRHGPVISDVYKAGSMPALKDAMAAPYVLSLQWSALMAGDTSGAGGLKLAHATNWQQFIDAAKQFHAPQQNFIYADTAGNIGYIAAGRVPVRKANNDLKGLAPALGWDAKYDWDGWVPFEQLPTQFNPASGYISTANEKRTQGEAGSAPFLTSEWALPYRAQRITQLIEARPKHTIASMAHIQTDTTSLGMAEFIKVATPLLKPGPWKAPLSQFDARMLAQSATPLVATAWWRHVMKRLFIDDMGEDAFVEGGDASVLWLPMLASLQGKSQTDWCDNIKTAVKETCELQVNDALQDALAELKASYGDEAKWQWGAAHTLNAEHRPFDNVPMLAPYFSGRMPLGGDLFTVFQLKHNFNKASAPYTIVHGPGYRGVFDLSQPLAHIIQSSGQSGLVGHLHYKDMMQDWAAGRSYPVPVDARQTSDGVSKRWILKAAP